MLIMAMPLDSMLEDIIREMNMFYMSEELELHEKDPCHIGDIGDGEIDDSSDSDDNNYNDEGTIVEHKGCNHDALHLMVKCRSGDADDGMLGIIKVMGNMLEGMVVKNKEWHGVELMPKLGQKAGNGIAPITTLFDGLSAPSIGVTVYLERIFRYSDCSPSCFVVALAYLDRFRDGCHIHITALNIHRLLITTVMLAAKFLDDMYV